MDRCQKIDCRTNGEVILRATRPLHLKGLKTLFTGSSAKPNGSRSPISTKNGIDSMNNISVPTDTIRTNIHSRPLNLKKIKGMMVWMPSNDKTRELYLDNIRLE